MRETRRLDKIRAETETHGVSIEDELESGESQTGSPTVKILQRQEDGSLLDVSGQFAVASIQYATVTLPNGDTHRSILWQMGPAAEATDQVAGQYHVEAQFTTDTGRKPVVTDSSGRRPVLQVR